MNPRGKRGPPAHEHPSAEVRVRCAHERETANNEGRTHRERAARSDPGLRFRGALRLRQHLLGVRTALHSEEH
jgi:hypothetical protein